MTLVTFALGLIGGVLLDRAVGGPGGLTVGIVVVLVPGTLAFVGPFAQQYWSNRFSTEASNRARFREHADQLVRRVLRPMASANLSYDVNNFAWAGQGRYRVMVVDESGSTVQMDSLVLWPFARIHILADKGARGALEDVEARADAGLAQKAGLDQATADVFEAALAAAFGFAFQRATPETGWSEWPADAMWYPEILIPRIRSNRAPDNVKLESSAIGHSTGDPPTEVQRVMMDGFVVLQVRAPLALTLDKYLAAYQSVRTNASLATLLAGAQSSQIEDAAAVRKLAELTADLAECVEATETLLPGTCPACEHLIPR